MKLSEAIRLGAMLKPQGFGHYESDKGTCAIGAAFDAGGREEMGKSWRRLEDVLDCVCPMCGVLRFVDAFGVTKHRNIIPHLNDKHCWTREQIADFVATVEARQAGDAVAGTVENHEHPVRATASSSLSSSSCVGEGKP